MSNATKGEAAMQWMEATHRVPTSGTAAWSTTDAGVPPAARLDPGLELQVVARQGDWAQIRCSNGWTAWVDARVLVPVAGGPPPARVSALAWSRSITVGGRRVEVGPAMVGAVVVAIGSMLGWIRGGGVSISSFDVKVNYLFSPTSRPSGPDLGLVLVAAAVGFAAMTVVGARADRRRWIAWLVVGIGVLFVVQLQRSLSDLPPESRPGLIDTVGLGVWATIVGGALMFVPTPAVKR